MTANGHTSTLYEQILNLRVQHVRQSHRRDQTAISAHSAAWLCDTLNIFPQLYNVLDLGSGFSTWVLRAFTRAHIVTVDHSAQWLRHTRNELHALGLPTRDMYELSDFIENHANEKFDLVFVDMGDTALRRQYFEAFLHWTAPGGLLVFDDWHMHHLREPLTIKLQQRGLSVVEIPETLDQYGRFLAMVRV
jgi:predicted O-methyltransferase YrrM